MEGRQPSVARSKCTTNEDRGTEDENVGGVGSGSRSGSRNGSTREQERQAVAVGDTRSCYKYSNKYSSPEAATLGSERATAGVSCSPFPCFHRPFARLLEAHAVNGKPAILKTGEKTTIEMITFYEKNSYSWQSVIYKLETADNSRIQPPSLCGIIRGRSKGNLWCGLRVCRLVA